MPTLIVHLPSPVISCWSRTEWTGTKSHLHHTRRLSPTGQALRCLMSLAPLRCCGRGPRATPFRSRMLCCCSALPARIGDCALIGQPSDPSRAISLYGSGSFIRARPALWDRRQSTGEERLIYRITNNNQEKGRTGEYKIQQEDTWKKRIIHILNILFMNILEKLPNSRHHKRTSVLAEEKY